MHIYIYTQEHTITDIDTSNSSPSHTLDVVKLGVQCSVFTMPFRDECDSESAVRAEIGTGGRSQRGLPVTAVSAEQAVTQG